MPHEAVATVSVYPSTEGPDFPADTETITIRSEDFSAGGVHYSRFRLRNSLGSVLHVRLTPSARFMSVVPLETALGPGQQQIVAVRTDTSAARLAVAAGSPPGAVIELLYQRLVADGSHDSTVMPPVRASVKVHLPISTCPSCERSLDGAIAEGKLSTVPDLCPYCYERLRPCPICGTPNTWLARNCILDNDHLIRSTPDWVVIGGDTGHSGSVNQPGRANLSLSRRWSYPGVAPTRRETALTWSAPVAAFGLVAAAAATADGDALIFSFDAKNGAPLWDPYPLPGPVYPDHGGIAIASPYEDTGSARGVAPVGRLFAASIEGSCLCLDALRGTRLWEARVDGRVYGAVVPCDDKPLLLVSIVTTSGGGSLVVLGAEDGIVRHCVSLSGACDCAPAYADGLAFVHDDSGTLSAIDVCNGNQIWSRQFGSGFDASPVVRDGHVFTADVSGSVSCLQALDGSDVWRASITNASLSGTPALHDALLYVPADDGIYVIAAETGRAVRRYATRLPVRSSPIVRGGTLYFGCTDGAVYGSSAGGTLERLYETSTVGSQIVAAAALADDTIFVGATNGVLYALSLEPDTAELKSGW